MDDAERSDAPEDDGLTARSDRGEPGETGADMPEGNMPDPSLDDTRELRAPIVDPQPDPISEQQRLPWRQTTRPLTTTPLAEVGPERVARRRGGWILAAVAMAALLLALLSLAVNYLLVSELMAARQETRNMLDEAIESLSDATLGELAINYVFSDTIIYSGTMPVSETIVFPFEGTVPFQGRVPFQGVVPISFDVPLLGRQVIRVPIDTTVNVDTAVDVSTTVTIPLTMDFPFYIEIPVEMPVDLTISLDEQPAFSGVLQQLRETLIELRDRVLQ
jgi:hypothetical protein